MIMNQKSVEILHFLPLSVATFYSCLLCVNITQSIFAGYSNFLQQVERASNDIPTWYKKWRLNEITNFTHNHTPALFYHQR